MLVIEIDSASSCISSSANTLPYHFFSSPGPQNVQCHRENLFSYFLTFSEFEIHFSEFPLRCHWTLKWILFDLQNFQAQCFDLSRLFGSSGTSPMKWVVRKYSTRTQSVLHQFPKILCKNWTVEILQLDFFIFDSLLNDLTFSPNIRRNLSRRKRLLSSTWSIGRAKIQISFMRDLTHQSLMHSECRLDGPISSSAWYRTNSEVSRSLCSWKLFFKRNLVQEEKWHSSLLTKIIPSILWNSNLVLPVWMFSPQISWWRLSMQIHHSDPISLVLEDRVSSSRRSWECAVGSWLLCPISFLTPDETLLWSNSWFTWLFEALESCGRVFPCAQEVPWHQNSPVSVGTLPNLLYTYFSWALLDMTLCFLFERRWLQENIEKFIMNNNRRRWSQSSLVKLPLVNMSASLVF